MIKRINLCIVIILLVFSASTMQAATYSATFPSSGTFYSSATNGSGTIGGNGGQSAYMWTTGDYVSQTFNGTGLNSVDFLAWSFPYFNELGGGSTLTVGLFVNGNEVDSFIAPDTNYSNIIYTPTNAVSFSPIVGGGTYTLSMVLEGTVPPDDGSISFFTEGTWTLFGETTGVPEPATMLLLVLGLVGLAGVKRKFKK